MKLPIRCCREGYHLSRPRDPWDALKQKAVEEPRRCLREGPKVRYPREREKGEGDSEANGVGPKCVMVVGACGEGREEAHKAEILRAGAGAPRGLRRRNHNAERS